MEKHLDNKMYRQVQIRINKFRQVQKGQRINIGQYRQAQSNIDNQAYEEISPYILLEKEKENKEGKD